MAVRTGFHLDGHLAKGLNSSYARLHYPPRADLASERFVLLFRSQQPTLRWPLQTRKSRRLEVSKAHSYLFSSQVETAASTGSAVEQASNVPSLERPPWDALKHGINEGPPPLYASHMEHLWRTLGSLPGGMEDLPLPQHFASRRSRRRQGPQAQIQNWLVLAERLRRVRMTYFDAGPAGQAFNALLYPDCRYDLPLLGIDLLSFGKKVLCVIDFQPLHQDPTYMERHTACMEPVWQRYKDLCSRMSSRHFDEAQFFSQYMLFLRTQDFTVIHAPNGRLYQALEDYLGLYLIKLALAEPDADPASMALVLERQIAYEQYNADRDPAIALFNTYFGKEWSHDFTYGFLFPGARH